MRFKTLFYFVLLTFISSLIPAAHTQTFSVLHAFTGGDGGGPEAGVTYEETHSMERQSAPTAPLCIG